MSRCSQSSAKSGFHHSRYLICTYFRESIGSDWLDGGHAESVRLETHECKAANKGKNEPEYVCPERSDDFLEARWLICGSPQQKRGCTTWGNIDVLHLYCQIITAFESAFCGVGRPFLNAENGANDVMIVFITVQHFCSVSIHFSLNNLCFYLKQNPSLQSHDKSIPSL